MSTPNHHSMSMTSTRASRLIEHLQFKERYRQKAERGRQRSWRRLNRELNIIKGCETKSTTSQKQEKEKEETNKMTTPTNPFNRKPSDAILADMDKLQEEYEEVNIESIPSEMWFHIAFIKRMIWHARLLKHTIEHLEGTSGLDFIRQREERALLEILSKETIPPNDNNNDDV
jgi:hypothetical protein